MAVGGGGRRHRRLSPDRAYDGGEKKRWERKEEMGERRRDGRGKEMEEEKRWARKRKLPRIETKERIRVEVFCFYEPSECERWPHNWT